ncbi:MAG: lipid-A-disaccharide synthase [Pseudomonadota bacterium]|nr:lipid-A-disaccharide synthase [Pseudomonadota bacterium]
MSIKIGLLAGEPSGDNLAAGLMAALHDQAPAETIKFIGVGGPAMIAQGLRTLAPFESLAVNGFKEPLLRLPQLWRLYRQLAAVMQTENVDLFVGVDFNVFNFLLEGRLRKAGIATAHYVSPSVYAWRRGRTKKVARCADLLFCLYPFEPQFYAGLPLRAVFVGHPLAEAVDMDAGSSDARQRTRAQLQVAADDLVIAVLPGSRGSEVGLMLEPFLQAAQILTNKMPERRISLLIPCVNETRRQQIEQGLQQFPQLPVTLVNNDARSALAAADAAMIKSGTSTLEAMLLRRPMVVSYRLGNLSYRIASRLVNTPFIALPNILAGQALVPELIQDAATPEAIAQALVEQLEAVADSSRQTNAMLAFQQLHQQLRQGESGQGASATAAGEILDLLDSRKV